MLQNDVFPIARTIADTRATVAAWRSRGYSVGLVPTMGSLHAGHLALVERARAENDRVLATVFVNPLQFGPAEDFDAYPRDDASDFATLREHRCDAVFAPPASEMFPDGRRSIADASTRVSVAPLASVLCGRSRPGHFDGVATIVLKLFGIAQPDAAYFGEKDFQQLTIVRRMVSDLSVPVRIAGIPIVREADGLAMSSRNAYLDAAQRAIAPRLHASLLSVQERIALGDTADAACAHARETLVAAGFDAVDYVELAAADTLQSLREPIAEARVFGAAWLGRTRLIDNIPLAGGA